MFLSRLNPVSVFHKCGIKYKNLELRFVSIPPKSGLSFSQTSEVQTFTGINLFLSRLNPVSVFHSESNTVIVIFQTVIVSIPPKSGLSFSQCGIRFKKLELRLFLSRLNPVSVFHDLRGASFSESNGLFLSRLNPVSVFHLLDGTFTISDVNCFYPA